MNIAGIWGRGKAWLQERLQPESFNVHVLVMTLATALGQGVVVLFLPILTRLYAPAHFGVLAVFASLASIALVAISLRYELAIPLEKDETGASNLLALCLLVLLGMIALLSIAVWWLGGWLTGQVNAPELQPYLWLLPVGLCFTGLYQMLNYWAVRKKAFKLIARTRMTQSIGQVFSQLGIGLIHSGPGGLITGFIIGHAAGSSSFATLAWRQDSVALRQVSPAGIRQVARHYWRFPVFSSSAGLLNASALQLPPILLAAIYSPQVAGWFLLSQRLIGLPLFVVGNSIAQVFYSEAAQRVREDPGSLRALFFGTTRKTFLLGLPIGLVALVGPWFFGIVFGEAWTEAGTYTQVLALAFVLQFTTSPVGNLNIYSRNAWMLAWDAARLSLIVGGFWLAGALAWPPVACIALYGGVMSGSYMVLYGLNLLAIQRLNPEVPQS